MSDKNELELLLRHTIEDLQRDFSSDQIDRLKTGEIQTQLRRFKTSKVDPLVEEMKRVTKIINSPIHIGMLGRYSHGKSALVNSLFMLAEESRLPEGEGIVTSKVTHVCFSKNESNPIVFEMKKTGELHQIDIGELRNCVGRSAKDTSTVDYYKMILPEENKDFASLFVQKNINLVDMPGLGGPYFNDQVQTKRYIRELDMIIAVIKIDKIFESGQSINTLIEMSNTPVIPVLTFADQWHDSDLYSDCNDFPAAFIKARKLITENIPALARFVDNLIAVSAVSGQNINELRGLILNNIETTNISISKARKDVSPVYRKQLREFQQAFSQLKIKMKDLCSDMNEILRPLLPSTSGDQKNCIEEAEKDRWVKNKEQNLFDQADKRVNSLFSKYKDRISQLDYVNESSELRPEVQRIINYTNDLVSSECAEPINSSFNDYKHDLSAALFSSLDNMALDTKTRNNLKKEIERSVESREIDLDDVLGVSVDSGKIEGMILKHQGKYQSKRVLGFMASMAQHPSTLIIFIVGVALTLAAGGFKVFKFLIYVGPVLIVASVIMHLFEHANDGRRFFEECKKGIKESLLKAFDCNARKHALKNIVAKRVLELKDEITDILSKDTESYNADARLLVSVKDKIEDSILSLSNKLDDELCEVTVSYK